MSEQIFNSKHVAISADIVHHFSALAAGLRYEDLPEAAREAAKKSILDTFGVMLAASGMEPAVLGVIEVVKESAGTPRRRFWALGARPSDDGGPGQRGAGALPGLRRSNTLGAARGELDHSSGVCLGRT